ncbi:unnamed protein product [Ostreobium quekettii]|uniref:BTB domain-containing protein n=1 Tax=Ostreobium quekettii TaxID=121088 RepID=A0A8S1IY78_9CHLO|nr:unnamed protein product [Ostreobium quekettii]|eukprot:evm.model.scf_249.5 EVM.evm.TU.scf_249.5   scf_249:31459-34816(+)
MAAAGGPAATFLANPSQQGGEDLIRMLRTRWDDGAFSDIRVRVFNNEYPLHRMVLCRSPFFDRLLQGEWREKNREVVTLECPDPNITCEAFEVALAHMYAKSVCLEKHNVLQVLAAASYLDLQDLCNSCIEFIVDDMRSSENFLYYYGTFLELEFGQHSERVRRAGWRHLCMMGVDQLRLVLLQLDVRTLKRLLMSDELWVRTELDRFSLIKDVMFPKFYEAREACKAAGGEGGLPLWSCPSLGSPRDPWIVSDASTAALEKGQKDIGQTSARSQENGGVTSDALLDSAEVRDVVSPVPTNSRLQMDGEVPGGVQNGTADNPSVQSVEVNPDADTLDSGREWQLLVLGSEEPSDDAKPSTATMKEDPVSEDADAKEEQENGNSDNSGTIMETTYDMAGDRTTAASEVVSTLNCVSDVLGLEGVKYSHIQLPDLAKIEIELYEMQLNRAHHALLQGMRTETILNQRIAAYSAQISADLQQQQQAQQQNNARHSALPKNLHPYTRDDLQELYSRWWLPSFRFGVEFENVMTIKPHTEHISEPHFYAGSVWKVRLLIDDAKNEVRLHLFRNQKRVPDVGGIPLCYDAREVVCTRFKFLVPGRDETASRSSRPGRFQQKKGRGWNDFLQLDNIERFLTPWGSLRVTVIVYPPFEDE